MINNIIAMKIVVTDGLYLVTCNGMTDRRISLDVTGIPNNTYSLYVLLLIIPSIYPPNL